MISDAGSGMDNSTIQISDLNDDAFRKSMLFATAKKSNTLTTHAQPLTLPHVQASRDVDRVAGSEELDHEYLWLPSRNYDQADDRARVDRYRQMEFTRNDWIYRIYTPLGGVSVFLFFGILLSLLSVAQLYSSWTSHMQEIDYSAYTNDPIEFEVPYDIKAPVYFYFKITDFYAIHKRVAYGANPSLVTSGDCEMFKTFEEILDLRCVNKKNTLNGIDEWCEIKDKEPAFKKTAYPCGAISATIITDNFSVCQKKELLPAGQRSEEQSPVDNQVNNCLPISMGIPDYDYSLFHFNQNRPEASSKGFQWIDLSNLMFRNWIQIPYDSTFLKPYGVLNQTLSAGKYYLHVTKNLWPAEHWKAKKYVVIAKPGYMGTKAIVFECLAIITAVVYLITGTVLFFMYKASFHCGVSPWKGLQVNKQKDVAPENPTGNYYRSDAPKPTEHVEPAKMTCLCPLH
ncbi:LEM3 (ligand-effect modulator 3) / CDC50 family protein [Babesia bovis T2Bo]|uniref:LEM3 / CDC50 family protein n=1 Tax=Babesia bovis TaxID=5865 RepID=A7AWI9_BABBO|nr:LEM3 (ligand-effect modulator 3) / CDC50 family protein [Babesia bovis T2Bo]EDO05417.1 LEM3 (ligand-effect modulator 3) / CDC50 family protein [Babesia bovis T2Bo]|eukprot:XP_001608985.1 hypothetical protein [Babesia bovis T2Bo]